MPDTFYCDPNVITDASVQKDEVLRARLLEYGILKPSPAQPSAHFAQALQAFLTADRYVSPDAAQRFITAYREPRATHAFPYELNEHTHAYILYSPNHRRHPYAARGYNKVDQGTTCTTPIFDSYPDRFKKVYEDGTRVIIWQWQ